MGRQPSSCGVPSPTSNGSPRMARSSATPSALRERWSRGCARKATISTGIVRARAAALHLGSSKPLPVSNGRGGRCECATGSLTFPCRDPDRAARRCPRFGGGARECADQARAPAPGRPASVPRGGPCAARACRSLAPPPPWPARRTTLASRRRTGRRAPADRFAAHFQLHGPDRRIGTAAQHVLGKLRVTFHSDAQIIRAVRAQLA